MNNIPSIDLHSHTKKVFKETIQMFYESVRQGSYDFPTKDEWIEEEWKQFQLDNPKVCGLTYDKEKKDWVHKYKGGQIRVIL